MEQKITFAYISILISSEMLTLTGTHTHTHTHIYIYIYIYIYTSLSVFKWRFSITLMSWAPSKYRNPLTWGVYLWMCVCVYVCLCPRRDREIVPAIEPAQSNTSSTHVELSSAVDSTYPFQEWFHYGYVTQNYILAFHPLHVYIFIGSTTNTNILTHLINELSF